MKINIDWSEFFKAILKAALPFFSSALGGPLSGCSVYGTGAGVTF